MAEVRGGRMRDDANDGNTHAHGAEQGHKAAAPPPTPPARTYSKNNTNHTRDYQRRQRDNNNNNKNYAQTDRSGSQSPQPAAATANNNNNGNNSNNPGNSSTNNNNICNSNSYSNSRSASNGNNGSGNSSKQQRQQQQRQQTQQQQQQQQQQQPQQRQQQQQQQNTPTDAPTDAPTTDTADNTTAAVATLQLQKNITDDTPRDAPTTNAATATESTTDTAMTAASAIAPFATTTDITSDNEDSSRDASMDTTSTTHIDPTTDVDTPVDMDTWSDTTTECSTTDTTSTTRTTANSTTSAEYMLIDSQNVHGVGRGGVRFGKLVEIRREMRAGGVYATLLQETHLNGNRRYEFRDGAVLLTAGNEQEQDRGNDSHWCGRGGVGILLSHTAAKDWRASGSRTDRYGERIIAVTVCARTPGRGGRTQVRLVSSYAPVVASANKMERATHLALLAVCIRSTKHSETLIIGTDTNVRLGTNMDNINNGGVGNHGISADGNTQPHRLAAKKLHETLSQHGLCAASTYFASDTYTTYTTNNGRELQLDHILVRKRDLPKFHWVGVTQHHATHSDHRRIRAELRAVHGKKQLPRRTKPDLQILHDRDHPDHDTFIDTVAEGWRTAGVTPHDIAADTLGRAHIAIRTAVAMLPRVDAGHKGWTDDTWHTIKKLSRAVDNARNRRDKARKRSLTRTLNAANKQLKWARHAHALQARAAVNAHAREMCQQLNGGGCQDMTHGHTADAWKLARRLMKNPHDIAQRKEMRLRHPETGRLAQTENESAEIFCDYVAATLSMPTEVDREAIAGLHQHPIMNHLSNAPSQNDIDRAMKKLRTARAEGEAKVPIAALKALYRHSKTRATLTNIVAAPWTTGSYPGEHTQVRKHGQMEPTPPSASAYHNPCCSCEAGRMQTCGAPTDDARAITYPEWQAALLTPGPKKGDEASPASWRLLCISEPLGAVFMSVLETRIQTALDPGARDNQNGFRAHRSTTDAQHCVLQAIRQRSNQGLHTWAILMDLVKAFESLSQEACWGILAKLGVPAHVVNLLRRFYDSFTMRLKVGPLIHSILVKRGIRTGGGEGPTLFNAAINVALDHVEWPAGATPTFFGVRHLAASSEHDKFEYGSSEFADDAMAIFTSRDSASAGAAAYDKSVNNYTGMRAHCAAAIGEQSKTVAICFPAVGCCLDSLDTSPLTITRCDGSIGYINFADSVIYLGMTIHHTADDEHSLDARLDAAARMERSTRRVTTSKHVEPRVKGNIIQSTTLPVLLFTSELWCMTTRIMAKMTSFWHRCCRRALRWTRAGMARRGTHMHDALTALGLKPISYYLRRRTLTWAGKIARMHPDRFVRRLLVSNACRPLIHINATFTPTAQQRTPRRGAEEVNNLGGDTGGGNSGHSGDGGNAGDGERNDNDQDRDEGGDHRRDGGDGDSNDEEDGGDSVQYGDDDEDDDEPYPRPARDGGSPPHPPPKPTSSGPPDAGREVENVESTLRDHWQNNPDR